jgi:hypothetical protein
MSEAWTGRKYRGIVGGKVYTVLAEPFEFEGGQFFAWHEPSHNHGQPIASAADFENRNLYARIIEPKFAIGDVVTEDFDRYRIIGVSSEPDGENDFAYLGKATEGSSITILWQSQISKVSQ